MSPSIDPDHLRDALAGATPAGRDRDGRDRAVPTDAAVRAFGRRVRTFLEEMPGDLAVMTLRDQLDALEETT